MSRAIPTLARLNAWRKGSLPRPIGLKVLEVGAGRLRARMPIRPDLLAPNGYLHAASIIGLADTACGYGTIADPPDQAKGFTTIELKNNFLGTALEGCETTRPHRGRTTQAWDATVRTGSGGPPILFSRMPCMSKDAATETISINPRFCRARHACSRRANTRGSSYLRSEQSASGDGLHTGPAGRFEWTHVRSSPHDRPASGSDTVSSCSSACSMMYLN